MITLRLRKMGQTSSQDIAAVTDSVPFSRLDSGWFRVDFSRVARSLLNQLEQSYHGAGTITVAVVVPEPEQSDQPTLGKLASVLEGRVKEALLESSVFLAQPSGLSGSFPRGATLHSYYAINQGKLTVSLRVLDEGGVVLAASQLTLSLQDVPKDLL